MSLQMHFILLQAQGNTRVLLKTDLLEPGTVETPEKQPQELERGTTSAGICVPGPQFSRILVCLWRVMVHYLVFEILGLLAF